MKKISERSIDKNDVDISQLYRWKTKSEISDPITGERYEFYMRLVGDSDLNRAKVYGYRTASDLRKKLNDKDSDERLSYIAEIEDYENKEILIQTIVLLETPEIYQDAIKQATDDVVEPVEPKSDSPQVAWEEYQEKIDKFEVDFQNKLEDIILEIQGKEEKRLETYDIKELHNLYLNVTINRLCEEAFQNAYYDMCVFLGTFLDGRFTKRAFLELESYQNAHPTLKINLRNKYRDLEIGIDLLKKLPAATESPPSGL